jgi:cyanophycinase
VAKKRKPRGEDAAASFPQLQVPIVPGKRRAANGALVIIGGHEDKRNGCRILKEVAARAHKSTLVVATVATEHPDEVWAEYRSVFKSLGVRSLSHLHVETRDDAFSEDKLKVLKGAGAVFFTGGDQLRITSRIGGAPICERIREIFDRGGVIAGTSAGASAMSETMLVSGPSDQSHRVDAVQMAPGLGLINGVIVDQHFAERGRLGRLVGAVAQNPRLLGVGIDEDTAVIAEADRFIVIGRGAVYVIDGTRESYTNVSEEKPDSVMSVFDLRLHILSDGDRFELETRRPEKAMEGRTAKRA